MGKNFIHINKEKIHNKKDWEIWLKIAIKITKVQHCWQRIKGLIFLHRWMNKKCKWQ